MYKKICNRILSFLLPAVMLGLLLPAAVSLMPATPARADDTWDGSSANTSWSGDGNEGNPYIIAHGSELKGLANLVNNGTSSFSGVYFKLADNISLGNYPWIPIGGHCSLSAPEEGVLTGYYFAGIFDGDNNAVSGINVSNPAIGTGGYGLFGYVNGGTIANLSVAGSVNMGTNPISEAGGVVGRITNGSLYNLHSSVTVYSADSTGWNSSQIGGIAGVVKNTSGNVTQYVKYCSNTGSVTGRGRVGGIVGAVYCVSNGGVVVDRCFNTGDVTSVYSTVKIFSGSIVGYCRGYISDCYNRGDLANDNGHYLGGIAGLLQGYSPVARMTNCYSTANFSGNYNPGYDHALWAYADGSSSVNVNNCFYVEINPDIEQPVTSSYGTCIYVTEVTVDQMQGAVLDEVNASGNFSGKYVLGDFIGTAAGGHFVSPFGGGYPVLDWEGTGLKVTGLSGGSPSGSFTDTDDPGAIYLDGTALTNGSGSKTSPYSNLTSALGALTSTNSTIYITGKVSVSGTFTISSAVSGARIMRSCLYNGYLAEVVSGGNLTLEDIILDGNSGNVSGSGGSLVNLTGGDLVINEDTILQNNYANSGGAIRITDGNVTMNSGGTITNNTAASIGGGVAVMDNGQFTMTGGTITGNSATDGDGVFLSDNTSTFNLMPSGSFTLYDSVYLGNSTKISVTGLVTNNTCDLTVKIESPSDEVLIAQKVGTTFSNSEKNKFSYETGYWDFKRFSSNTQIVLDDPSS